MQKTLLYSALLVLATVAFRWPMLNVPLERDEGEYTYIAWRLEHHEVPYRDWVDQKPPGVFWAYRVALALPLPPVASIHIVAMTFSAATACTLFLLVRRLTSEGWALGGAALFALLSADPHAQGNAANTEVFMLLPLVLAQWAFLYVGPRTKGWVLWIFACGAFVGVATAFKQVAAATWPLLALLYAAFHEEKYIGRHTIYFAVLSAAGIMSVWVAIALYFRSHNAMGPLLYHVLTHNLEYINTVPWSDRLKLIGGAMTSLAATQAIAWLLALFGIVAVCRERRWGMLLLLSEWFIASAAGVGASGYFFPHYFQQALPALCAIAAIGARFVAESSLFGKVGSAPRNGMVAAICLGVPVISIAPFWVLSPEEAVHKIYPNNYFAEMQAVGKRLSETTTPSDKIYVFGAEPEVLFYAQRISATRYIFLFPLYGPYSDAKENQLATIQELTTNRPAALLYFPNRLFFMSGTEQLLTQWTQAQLSTNFSADLWLAADQKGAGHLYHGEGMKPPAQAAGQRILGGLFLRKPKP